MNYVLIVGGKSGIAKSLAKVYAKKGYNLYLAARNCSGLSVFARDLEIRNNIKVLTVELNILDYSSHESIYKSLPVKPIGCIICVGYLGSQQKAELDFSEAELITSTNYTGVMSFTSHVANDFDQRKEGFIIGISSVAADRGRATNYYYGAAKAALSTYLSGLRNRLARSHVHVMTVHPGFVATKMTENLDIPKLLTANSDDVALDIFSAQQKKRNIIYTRFYWRWIMLLIKSIPEFQFKKMSL